MYGLLIGFLLVVVSAAGFGWALFGRRPVPQPATTPGHGYGDTAGRAEMAPSDRARPSPSARRPVAVVPPPPPAAAAPGSVARADARGASVPVGVRLRSLALLVVATLGAAVLVGAVLSILVVGLVLIVV
jgi:hypothetical protein